MLVDESAVVFEVTENPNTEILVLTTNGADAMLRSDVVTPLPRRIQAPGAALWTATNERVNTVAEAVGAGPEPVVRVTVPLMSVPTALVGQASPVPCPAPSPQTIVGAPVAPFKTCMLWLKFLST